MPYPYASNNHQLYNANVLAKSGQATVVTDQSVSPDAVSVFLSHIQAMTIKQPSDFIDLRHALPQLAKFP